VVEFAESLAPSARGEIEITDLNCIYLENRDLNVEVLGRGVAWLDAGTHESLLQAAQFVQTLEERQGMMISCPEEIAYRLGFIDKETLVEQAQRINNQYGDYLLRLVEEEIPFHER
jgi:glucose-1-phosphate thymidylyltransferase